MQLSCNKKFSALIAAHAPFAFNDASPSTIMVPYCLTARRQKLATIE